MKRLLFVLALAGTGFVLTPGAALAQGKPELNTAPPGAKPQPAQPSRPPAVPVPVPPPTDEPLPAPRPNSPSGMELPKGTSSAEQPKILRKTFLYSNFGLGYSSNSYEGGLFHASLSPAIGYRLTDRFAVGPGITYSYTHESFSNLYQSVGFPSGISEQNIGVKVFAQYKVISQFFLHAEYEVTRAQSYNVYEVVPQQQYQVVRVNRNIATPLAGAGYRQQFSDRAAADILLLYNFNDGINDIYGQPVIRFSFLYDLK